MPRASRSGRQFPPAVLSAIARSRILGIKAGRTPHRVIGIWAVVVEGRVFVRSWSITAGGWYRTLLEEPEAIIQVGARTRRVRAVRTRSDRLKDEVSRAYLEKYATPGSVTYARDLGRPRSRATTTELVPR